MIGRKVGRSFRINHGFICDIARNRKHMRLLIILFFGSLVSAKAQSNDSSAVARMYQAGFYLDKFVTQHNTGLAILLASGAVGILAPTVFPVQTDIHGVDKNKDTRTILYTVCGLGSIAGLTVTLDSFKQLRRASRRLMK
mgnify:CR=1 FL=1